MSDYVIVNGELRHFGIKGMKWGVRRYQNNDGTLTAAGKKRYDGDWDSKSHRPKSTAPKTSGGKSSSKASNSESEKKGLTDKQKKALKIGAAAVGTAVAAYGAYKLNDYVKTKNYEIAAQRGREAATKMFNKSMLDAANDTKSMSRSVKVNVNAYARDEVNRASKDNFRTALKNVTDYKRSGGDLKNLSSLNNYKGDQWLEAEFLRKKRS